MMNPCAMACCGVTGAPALALTLLRRAPIVALTLALAFPGRIRGVKDPYPIILREYLVVFRGDAHWVERVQSLT